MSKMSISKLSKKEYGKMKNLLYLKISSLKNKKDTENFLSDLLTESELIMILRRLQIAKLLLNGETYFQIKKKLNVGIDNIKNVRRKIDFGKGGYIKFIKKL